MGADLLGKRVAHFRVVSKLGEGGMGVVYKAIDEKLERAIALKILAPEFATNEDRRRRFLREGRAAAALTHPNIATVYEIGTSEDCAYIAMELVRGESLRARLARGPVRTAEVLRIAGDIGRGLARAHDAGIVHRDLKPDNVMLGIDGEVKLLDFGLAKVRVGLETSLTQSALERAETPMASSSSEGRVIGSPQYMSPEQAAGKDVDHRTDIFALGIVMYELLSGKCPFVGTTSMEVLVSISRDTPPSLATIAPEAGIEVQRLVEKCLAKHCENRFASVRDLIAALDRLAAPVQGAAPPVGAVPSPARSVEARPSKKEASDRRPTAEPQQRRFFVPAARRAAVMLWGDDGLNDIAQRIPNDTREEFFRTASADEWIPARHVIHWCFAVWEGPVKNVKPKMMEYIDRVFDFSYGVVRRGILKLADPVVVVPKAAALWKEEHTAGSMEAALDDNGKGCVLRIRDTPYTLTPQARGGMAESYRYAFSLTRAKNVTETHALESKGVLVIRLRWD